MCSVISASRSCCTTFRRSHAGSQDRPVEPLAPTPCPTYDDLWPSSLRFDWLTLNTNHLGGRWPFLLADNYFTEVYGHYLLRLLGHKHLLSSIVFPTPKRLYVSHRRRLEPLFTRMRG